MNIFIKSDLTLDALGDLIRKKFNIPDQNPEPFTHQKRYGDNMGGDYYEFVVLGLELNLLENARDAEISEREEWQFILLIYPQTEIETELLFNIIRYICYFLCQVGITADSDST